MLVLPLTVICIVFNIKHLQLNNKGQIKSGLFSFNHIASAHMSTEQRKQQYRDGYYKNHEINKEKARLRSAASRATNPETPEEAEARRIYNRAHYAKNTGPVKMEERRIMALKEDEELKALVPVTEPERTIYKMLLIGLLAEKAKAQDAYRRQWKNENYVPRPKKEKGPKPPKELKPKKPLQTEADKKAWKRAYEKRRLVEASGNPEALAAIRKNRSDAGRRWINKMRTKNPEKYKARVAKESMKELEKRRKCPQRKISVRMRTQVYSALRRQMAGKYSSTFNLLGCDIQEFMVHIERQFVDGMNWNNFGKGVDKWAIDHIRPCASFNLTDPDQQRQAFHYTNLRPMWFSENCSKGATHGGRRWKHADHALLGQRQD